MKAEEERKRKEAEEEQKRAQQQKSYRSTSPQLPNKYPYQQNRQTEISNDYHPSFQDMDSMEEALEEFIEGGGY